jgi:seryl-tRNA synthetase
MTIHTAFELKPLHSDFLITDDGLFFAGTAGSKLIHAFDSKFRCMALTAGAEERKFPTVIAEGTLNRSEYFQSFPGYASSVIEPSRKGRYFLSPAVCYHCYELLKSSVLQGETLITCCGKCFRADSADDFHLWEFTMREVVFFGSAGFIREQRDAWKQRILDLSVRLGLAAEVVAASDPFFGAETRGKRLLQQVKELKYELRVRRPSGKDMPLASFNLHERFFTSKFDITIKSADTLHSGCVAFGLERWCMAMIEKHGVQEALRLVENVDDLR